MTPVDYKIKILQLAADEKLPEFIEDDSIAQRQYFRELFDAKWLSGWECPSDGSPDDFQQLTITHAGREGLQSLLESRRSASTIAVAARTSVKMFKVIAAIAALAVAITAIIAFWYKLK